MQNVQVLRKSTICK